MKTKRHYPLSLDAFHKADEDLQNRMLLDWLSDDAVRAELFGLVNKGNGRLEFPSRDSAPRECGCDGLDAPRKPAVPGHLKVTLVTMREQIEVILGQPQKYASRVYAELGGGSFMLALDPTARGTPDAHEAQRDAFKHSFPPDPSLLRQVAQASCRAAAVTSLRSPAFDLAAFAEQAALRFCQMLMGYSLNDYKLLETSLRAAYRALVYQVYERHFVSDPVVIPTARQHMGALLTRTAALIDAYRLRDEDDDDDDEEEDRDNELKGCSDPSRPPGFDVVLKKLARLPSTLNGEQRAIVAVGAAIGTVGNVQAAVCIAVKALFADPVLRARATEMLRDPRGSLKQEVDDHVDAEPLIEEAWKALLAGPLRANPPIPFLPRLAVDEHGEKRGELLLALGGGTAQADLARDVDDPLVWGLPSAARHNCAGRALAWPLLIAAVKEVMALPELEEGLKPVNARPAGLKKRHGFACERYPFTFRLDKKHAQYSLNVAMRIRAPVKDNADKLREMIRGGAPRIERVLQEARHIHFAWFEIIEGDTVLVLHTVYDGPFGAYLEHFALRAGDLFDSLFQFIEDPPPMPVRKFPYDFVAHLQRYNRQPAMGYFFSAYPNAEVARILRDMAGGP